MGKLHWSAGAVVMCVLACGVTHPVDDVDEGEPDELAQPLEVEDGDAEQGEDEPSVVATRGAGCLNTSSSSSSGSTGGARQSSNSTGGSRSSQCSNSCKSRCTNRVPEQACFYCQAACLCRCAGDSKCAQQNSAAAKRLGTTC